MKLAFIAFLALAGLCTADTLRLSQVMEAASDDTERMTYTFDGRDEVLFVKKAVIVGDKDVEQAYPDQAQPGTIGVKLNEDGGKKLEAATSHMRAGEDRIALIVDGRVMSAPVLQQVPLGASFQISGFKELDANAIDDLARKMSGQPPRPAGEAPPVPNPIPRPQTVPYTEEEYQQLKTQRESLGVFQLDSMPTEEELNKVLHKGMTYADVIKIYGRPYHGPKPPNEPDGEIYYEVAPEKRPENPEHKVLPQGFSVQFENRKVASWGHSSYSAALREEKVVGRQAPTLKMRLPNIDLSADDFDAVKLVEGIVIPDPTQKINDRDLGELLQIGNLLSNSLISDKNAETTLKADCDFIKTAAHHFPEVATLREQAKDGRISVKALGEAFKAYIMGTKALPAADESGPPK